MKSKFHQVDHNREHNIVWIEDDCDANGDAKMSVTNDAENVVTWFRSLYGNRIRIVYRDSNMEWREICWSLEHHGTEVSFRPWYGLVWAQLTKVEA